MRASHEAGCGCPSRYKQILPWLGLFQEHRGTGFAGPLVLPP